MHKFSIIIFIFSVLLFSGGLYSQDKEEAIAQLQEQGFDKAKMTELLEDLEKHSPEDEKQFARLRAGELGPQEAQSLMTRAFSKLPKDLAEKYSGGDLGASVEAKVNAGLDSFREVPYDVAFAHIKAKVDNSKGAALFQKIPKVYALFTNLIRDEVAPKKFFGIIKDKKRLITFAAISISLFIFSFILKRKRKKKNLPFGEAFIAGFGHFFFFTGLKLSVIYYFFEPEITPIMRVIKQTYS